MKGVKHAQVPALALRAIQARSSSQGALICLSAMRGVQIKSQLGSSKSTHI